MNEWGDFPSSKQTKDEERGTLNNDKYQLKDKGDQMRLLFKVRKGKMLSIRQQGKIRESPK
jgi:hypothetical protein